MLALKIIIIIVCVIVAAFIVAGIYAGHFASDSKMDIMKFVMNQLDPADSAGSNQVVADSAKEFEARVDQEYEITDREGLRLHGYFLRGDPDSDVYIFYSHGYRNPYGGLEAGEKIAIWEKKGYHVFSVDHRAHRKSEGRFISFGQHESDDCIEWLEFMKKEFGDDIRIILVGTSMGAATVMQMAGKEDLPDNVKLIIEDCGYTDFYSQAACLFTIPGIIKKPWLCATNSYLRLFHHINMHKADSISSVKKVKVPMLFLHGEKDTFVPVHMCQEVYEACASPIKQKKIFPEGTHATSYYHYPEEYTQIVCDFIDKYLTSE